MITVTDAAFQQLAKLVRDQEDPGKGLRISVESGGCAGMQYEMALDLAKPGDALFDQAGVTVMVDAQSLEYLKGSTVDYADDLAGAGFRIKNPNAARSCGCGTSFAPGEDAAAEPAHHH